MSVDIRLYSLILRASSEGYHDLVDRVLSRSAADHRPALLECRDDSGATPLMKSARAGHHPTVQVLLRFGASVSATSQLGNTSMHWACLGGFKPIVKCFFVLINS
uniref:Uncharacterized protein n=1 Tax=Spongospora subterranea TaxID=70186 RepID=A0A0H5R7B6_9EUKA|eukprot:CRZ10045.1 hypothetical protein [Spongospora subterranea]